jgi:sulfur transporter
MNPLLLYPLVAGCAFGVGFASQRGSVCGVLAARQIVETGRATRLVAFITASFWALVAVIPFSWWAPDLFALSVSYDGLGAPLIGGALYGLGTMINGACVFGTASRALSGNISFFAALPGIAFGAGIIGSTSLLPRQINHMASPLHEPNIGALVLLLSAAAATVVTLFGIVRSHRVAGLRFYHVLRAARWRTSFAMMVIGTLGGVAFSVGGPWSYPSLLRQAGNLLFGRAAVFPPATIIGPLALLAGGSIAALAGGRFVFQSLNWLQVTRSFLGGLIMGLAATMIPGGNDVLLLSALPSLALQGAVAYPAMLLVQIILSMIRKQWKNQSSRV